MVFGELAIKTEYELIELLGYIFQGKENYKETSQYKNILLDFKVRCRRIEIYLERLNENHIRYKFRLSRDIKEINNMISCFTKSSKYINLGFENQTTLAYYKFIYNFYNKIFCEEFREESLPVK